MSLIELIEKHKADLDVPEELSDAEVLSRYRPFREDLARLPSFTYTAEDMKSAQAKMNSLYFLNNVRERVVDYAIRRAAVEEIPDIDNRMEFWKLLESLDPIDWRETAKVKEQVEGYVRRVSKEKAAECVSLVQDGLKKIGIEVDKIRKDYLTAKGKELIIYFGIISSHQYPPEWERNKLGDISEIVQTL